MKYQPYPKYKDSGVEWLGEIPEGWDLKKLKFIVRFSGGGTPDTSVNEYWDGQIPWVSSKDMKSEIIIDTELKISNEGLKNSPAKLIEPNSVLMVVRSGILQHTLPVAINLHELVVNQDIRVITPLGEVLSLYLRQYFVGHNNQLLALLQKQGATVESIEQELLANCPIVLPPLLAQRAIAAFLDAETARIDGLVKDYEELIELLKEKRQALISHAVTRGLSELVSPDDPEFGEWAKPVKFKDSGVEWIGEIPEGWETWQIKRDVETVTSGSRGWAEFYSEEGSIFIRIGNLTRNGIALLLDDIQRVEVPENSEAMRTKVCESDLLVSITADIGSVALVENLSEAAYISQHLAICRFSKSTRVLPRWAAYFLKSHSGRTQFDQKAYGGTKIQLSLDDVRELLIAIPQKKEQVSIASFLDKETSKLDTLISESQSAIELLKEHRSALITNAVTGKIDVEASA